MTPSRTTLSRIYWSRTSVLTTKKSLPTTYTSWKQDSTQSHQEFKSLTEF